MGHKHHPQPLKAKAPNPPSKSAIEKQMAVIIFLLPTQTTQRATNQHTSPFQIDPSSDLILQHPPSSD